MNATAITTPPAADDNHMSSVRAMLIEQMRALRSAPPDQLATEAERARSVALVANAITSAARIEVEYVRTCPDPDTPVAFLQPKPLPAVTHPRPGSLVHRLQG